MREEEKRRENAGLGGDTAGGSRKRGGLRLISGVEPQKVCVAKHEEMVETAQAR